MAAGRGLPKWHLQLAWGTPRRQRKPSQSNPEAGASAASRGEAALGPAASLTGRIGGRSGRRARFTLQFGTFTWHFRGRRGPAVPTARAPGLPITALARGVTEDLNSALAFRLIVPARCADFGRAPRTMGSVPARGSASHSPGNRDEKALGAVGWAWGRSTPPSSCCCLLPWLPPPALKKSIFCCCLLVGGRDRMHGSIDRGVLIVRVMEC